MRDRDLTGRLNQIEALACFILAEQFDRGSLVWWFWYVAGFLTLFGVFDWFGKRVERWYWTRLADADRVLREEAP